MAEEEADDGALRSLFTDENYVLQEFALGPFRIPLLSLQCASTDYDLTGQILWPGTELLNDHILQTSKSFLGSSVIELGSGVGLTGLLCGHVACSNVVLTDHNDTVLKIMQRNVELQHWPSADSSVSCEKLDWGNEQQLSSICEKNPQGFDFILGADICYQQGSLPPLLKTVVRLLSSSSRSCKFLLGYVSRIRSTDLAFFKLASAHNLKLLEVPGSRTKTNGVVYEITLGQC